MNTFSKRLCEHILRKYWFLFSDSFQIKCYYYLEMGKKLNLKNPQTMNEKLQWLKLYNRHDKYTNLVDKLTVKDIVREKIGEQYVVPLLGTWNSFDEIDFDTLPNQFVLKTNHGGGNTGVVVVSDKSKLNIEAARRKIQSSMKSNIYHNLREWPYKNVKKKIFAEEYLGGDIADYKFYCFDGDADCVLMCVDRQVGAAKFYFFDKEWKLCRYNKRGKEAPVDFTLPKPEGINEMFKLASQLSKGFPFVRMDFYCVNGRIYFGEYTFYPASGYDYNRLPEADLYFGSKIKLPING